MQNADATHSRRLNASNLIVNNSSFHHYTLHMSPGLRGYYCLLVAPPSYPPPHSHVPPHPDSAADCWPGPSGTTRHCAQWDVSGGADVYKSLKAWSTSKHGQRSWFLQTCFLFTVLLVFADGSCPQRMLHIRSTANFSQCQCVGVQSTLV